MVAAATARGGDMRRPPSHQSGRATFSFRRPASGLIFHHLRALPEVDLPNQSAHFSGFDEMRAAIERVQAEMPLVDFGD
jgi:hypothetical protein